MPSIVEIKNEEPVTSVPIHEEKKIEIISDIPDQAQDKELVTIKSM